MTTNLPGTFENKIEFEFIIKGDVVEEEATQPFFFSAFDFLKFFEFQLIMGSLRSDLSIFELIHF